MINPEIQPWMLILYALSRPLSKAADIKKRGSSKYKLPLNVKAPAALRSIVSP